jgi:quinol monooxygenase YgiN
MVFLFFKMTVRPEKRKELSQTLQSIVEQVRKENGCLKSGLFGNSENEHEFLMLEEWESREALDNHLESDIFTVLVGAVGLMERTPEVSVHTVSHSRELAL